MKVFPERLESTLASAQSLARVYLIAGPERLLVEESCDAVRRAARQHQVAERIRLAADGRFNWDDLNRSTETGSLFATTRLVELRLPTGKPGAEGGKVIRAWLEKEPDDILLLICDQWDFAQENSVWFKAVDQAGMFVPCWQVKPDRLPEWIAQRLKSRGLSAEADTCGYLAARLEGNLLAAAQEVERLALLFPGQQITLEQVRQAVADHARFDSFRLVDLVMAGETGAALRCIRGLREVDTAPPAVLWALGRELEIASQIAARSASEPISRIFQDLRVWNARQSGIQACLNRLGARRINQSFKSLSRLDRLAKGQVYFEPKRGSSEWNKQLFWVELEQLCMRLASDPALRAA